MKAVLITKKNQNMLATRFDLEHVNKAEKDEELPIGYWLVTDFGNDDTFSLLTQEKLYEEFFVTIPDKPMKNGFISITKKE